MKYGQGFQRVSSASTFSPLTFWTGLSGANPSGLSFFVKRGGRICPLIDNHPFKQGFNQLKKNCRLNR